MMRFLIWLLPISIIVSCSTYSDEELNEFDKKIQTYLDKKGIECQKSPSGLYYKIIEQGDGEKIQYKDNVSFTYTGTFLNGKVFDKQDDPVEFHVETLIQAWKEVMLELNVGGKAFLVAPPQLGYGGHKLDDIPENSILVYELEVHQVK